MAALAQDFRALGPAFLDRWLLHGLGPLLYFHARREGRLAELPTEHLRSPKTRKPPTAFKTPLTVRPRGVALLSAPEER